MLCNLEKPNRKVESEKLFDEQGNLVNVVIHGMEGFNEKEKDYFIYALNIKKLVDNSQDYKLALLSAYMTQKQGKSNLEVYNHWRSGYSNFEKSIDSDLDYFVTLYQASNGTIGWTSMSTGKIFINKKFYSAWMLQKDGVAGLIGNLNHEYMHSMGYIHSGFGSYKRNSVPYVFGRVARELVVKHLNGFQLTPLA